MLNWKQFLVPGLLIVAHALASGGVLAEEPKRPAIEELKQAILTAKPEMKVRKPDRERLIVRRLDIVDDKRRAEGAISIWDRSPRYVRVDDLRARDRDPNVNTMIREPGHVEYASTLGLGVYDRAKLAVQDITV